jgi:hypothetical protein
MPLVGISGPHLKLVDTAVARMWDLYWNPCEPEPHHVAADREPSGLSIAKCWCFVFRVFQHREATRYRITFDIGVSAL